MVSVEYTPHVNNNINIFSDASLSSGNIIFALSQPVIVISAPNREILVKRVLASLLKLKQLTPNPSQFLVTLSKSLIHCFFHFEYFLTNSSKCSPSR